MLPSVQLAATDSMSEFTVELSARRWNVLLEALSGKTVCAIGPPGRLELLTSPYCVDRDVSLANDVYAAKSGARGGFVLTYLTCVVEVSTRERVAPDNGPKVKREPEACNATTVVVTAGIPATICPKRKKSGS